ncbi:MAG: TetR/AcrR family transcriptional regulator [Anaerolineaceae bacterium]
MVRIVKKPEVRKLEIVQAARDLFLTRDYDQVTMQDVVDALGLAKGTVYYYFPSKEDLLEAVVEHLIDEATAHMQTLVDNAGGAAALKKLELLVRGGRMKEEHANLLETIHRPGSSGLHARLLAAAILKQAPLYAGVIEQGCREGIFHTESPLEAAEFMLTGVQFLTDMGIHPWSGEDLARRAKAFPALLESLLAAPRGSCNFLF